MTTQSPKLKTIVSIRNLVYGISSDWKTLRALGREIDEMINTASTLFMNKAPIIAHERWLLELGKIEQNRTALNAIMNRVVDKINRRDAQDLAETWNSHQEYSSSLLENLTNLQVLGKTHLPESEQQQWNNHWTLVMDKFESIQQLVEASSLHLAMINEYTPAEVDELTHTILQHMPKKYTMEEATQYEQAYMKAYEELKHEAQQKKNLWDRFLDLLAGGTQQSPAERVMMQRWVEGEKGQL